MAKASEIPQLVGEFVDLSKEYLRQETIEPAKQLGRFIGFSFAASGFFILAALFLSIAELRWLLSLMPEGKYSSYWEGLGYILASLSLIVFPALIALIAVKASKKE